ncbi:metal-dependent phosphohydrolase [Pseudomonas phage vB_PpuM-NoPa]|uniref:Metal-dependent phosphohydrolase n=2 Tax=Tartuvirus TaxID=3424912 RepID=A0AAX4MZE8_9CAUD
MNTVNLTVRKLPQYALAIELATKWHAGQEYGDSGKEYMYHLLNVARIVKERNWMISDSALDDLLAVAILHDTLEDTKCTDVDLLNAGIYVHNVGSVQALTKHDGEKKRKYLRRVSEDVVALEVKICDTLTNLEHSVKGIAFKRIDKYAKQLQYLNERQNHIINHEGK